MDAHEDRQSARHATKQPSTRVRVECDRCGPQKLPARALTLRVCDDDGETSVRYACSRCDLVHVIPTTPEQTAALAACDDVRLETWTRPLPSIVPDAAGQPLTAMEIDAAAHLLDDDDALEHELEALGG